MRNESLKRKKTVLIATGGTGGHIFTGIALEEALNELARIVFVTSYYGLGKHILAKRGYKYYLIHARGVVGKSFFGKLLFGITLILGLFMSTFIILRERPVCVIGTGGFASFSPIFIAHMLGIYTLITEIDSIPGLATKVLSRFVNEVHLAFKQAKKHLRREHGVFVSGFPVRKEIKSITRQDDKRTIFVFGGSQGAHGINLLMLDAIKYLPKGYKIIWQTGVLDYEFVKSSVNYDGIEIYKFIDNMAQFYKRATLGVTRAGALTIAEISAVRLPCILIPFPHAAKKHQDYNAKLIESIGAGIVIKETELSGKLLGEKLIELLNDQEKLKSMQEKLSIIKVNGADSIKKRLEKCLA
mgnify:CR=1 FL=1